MLALEERERREGRRGDRTEDGGDAGADARGPSGPLFAATASVVGAFMLLLVCLSTRGSRALLLVPVDESIRIALSALGGVVGAWVSASVHEAWPNGLAPNGDADDPVRARLALLVRLALPIAIGAWCGFVFARQATEWRAFHGIHAPAAWESFRVAEVWQGRRGSRWLDLVEVPGGASISINCATHDCRGLDVGSAMSVRVETGRGGVRRAVFPP